MSIEDLLADAPKSTPRASKRGPVPRIQQQLEQVQRLPKAKQRFVSEMLDNMLAQANA